MEENINLVDKEGNRLGSIEKLEAHQKGKLHEAFSIFIFNSQKELLLQKRASNKYHSGGLWTNTCCGHPRFNEKLDEAAKRRLYEEMGIICNLRKIFSFTYNVKLPNDLIEYEFDYVFMGYADVEPQINRNEAEDYKWVKMNDLLLDIVQFPNSYTHWLKEILKNSNFVHSFNS